MDRREFKLMQLVGAVVFCAGALAANVNAISGAAIGLTVGIGIYLCGLVGSYLNTDE